MSRIIEFKRWSSTLTVENFHEIDSTETLKDVFEHADLKDKQNLRNFVEALDERFVYSEIVYMFENLKRDDVNLNLV
jgi:hypothetical protein